MVIDSEILERTINKFGRDAQVDKIQEEAQELALALHQYKCPTKDKEQGLADIYSELADMKIMMAQAELLFDKYKINEVVEYKLSRLEQYLK